MGKAEELRTTSALLGAVQQETWLMSKLDRSGRIFRRSALWHR
jgi:hypothetical protein